MNIYIDCGSYKGHKLRKHKSDKCYAFEPNPYVECDYDVIRKAVWIKDGKVKFYLRKDKKVSESSSIFSNKAHTTKRGRHIVMDKKHPIEVECFDFSKWIKENFKKNDHITLKMDIEGAEYEVFMKMIKDGTLKYINKIFVDWHWNKIGLKEETHNQIRRQVMSIVRDYRES